MASRIHSQSPAIQTRDKSIRATTRPKEVKRRGSVSSSSGSSSDTSSSSESRSSSSSSTSSSSSSSSTSSSSDNRREKRANLNRTRSVSVHSRSGSKDDQKSKDRRSEESKKSKHPSVSHSVESRSRSKSKSTKKKRECSPTTKPVRIHVGRLTRNVSKDHIHEIFSHYGSIKFIEFPLDRFHQKLGRGFAYVEYNDPNDTENAMKHMDGGQIDGQEVTVAPILLLKPRPIIRRSSPARRGWRRSPQRFRRGGRSPQKRRNSRRRSRSPIRRRRRSNSSDSSR